MNLLFNIHFNMMLSMAKRLKFYPTHMLASEPAGTVKDAARWHEMPRSETKELITPGTASMFPWFPPAPHVPPGQGGLARVDAEDSAGVQHSWEPRSSKITQSFIMGCKQVYPTFTRRETQSLLHWEANKPALRSSRVTMYIFHGHSLYNHPWKGNLEKNCPCLCS